jgi:hypothetical protein
VQNQEKILSIKFSFSIRNIKDLINSLSSIFKYRYFLSNLYAYTPPCNDNLQFWTNFYSNHMAGWYLVYWLFPGGSDLCQSAIVHISLYVRINCTILAEFYLISRKCSANSALHRRSYSERLHRHWTRCSRHSCNLCCTSRSRTRSGHYPDQAVLKRRIRIRTKFAQLWLSSTWLLLHQLVPSWKNPHLPWCTQVVTNVPLPISPKLYKLSALQLHQPKGDPTCTNLLLGAFKLDQPNPWCTQNCTKPVLGAFK